MTKSWPVFNCGVNMYIDTGVFELYVGSDGETTPEEVAVIELIASAPALLELCKTAQKHIGCILENPGISGILSPTHRSELASTKLELDRIIASVESEAS